MGEAGRAGASVGSPSGLGWGGGARVALAAGAGAVRSQAAPGGVRRLVGVLPGKPRAAGGSGRGTGEAAPSGRTLEGLHVYCLRGSFPEKRSGRGSARGRAEGGEEVYIP